LCLYINSFWNCGGSTVDGAVDVEPEDVSVDSEIKVGVVNVVFVADDCKGRFGERGQSRGNISARLSVIYIYALRVSSLSPVGLGVSFVGVRVAIVSIRVYIYPHDSNICLGMAESCFECGANSAFFLILAAKC
jgi:hypothetical protein